ncbi:hypothetical protein QR685DRAFT_569666 [Neurospora intermedia]|uniref:Uncharacterized protein n=1 Tax=Neurospora intermedia TaxID=5142 RepID=A0ABR3DLT9_NEUIN
MPGLAATSGLPLSLHNGNPRGNGHSGTACTCTRRRIAWTPRFPRRVCDECDLATLTFHSASNPEPRCLLDTAFLSLGAPLGGRRDVHFFQIPGQGHVTVLIEETARTIFVAPVIPFTEPSPISCAWGHVHPTERWKHSNISLSHKTKFVHSLTVFFLFVITCALLPSGLEVLHCVVVVKLNNIGLLQAFLGLGLVLFRLMMRVKVQWTRLHCGPIASSYPQSNSPTSRDVMDCDYLMC